MLDKIGIAKRIAKGGKRRYVRKLGNRYSHLVANYIPEGINVVLQSENGLLGMGPVPVRGRRRCRPHQCRQTDRDHIAGFRDF